MDQSPPCEQYSQAKTTGAERNLELANSLVRKTLEIINYFKGGNPDLKYWVENPSTGLLCGDRGEYKKQTLLDDLPFKDVDYCQYSSEGDEFPYRKATRIWGNALRRFVPRKCPGPRACKMMNDGRHYCNPGNNRPEKYLTEWKGMRVSELDEKHRIPMKLIRSLFNAA